VTESNPEQVTVTDKRRIDPETGEVRQEAAAPAAASDEPAAAAAPAGVPAAETELQLDAVAELTADLQRVQAEFANYRRRVERDRQAVAEQALGSVLLGLLPVLDDLDRARAHGEVEGGFKLVADGLETTLGKLGLERFGEPGEAFDPNVHEALTHALSADVTEATCVEIYQPGYRVGERVLRPARVAVAEPDPSSTPDPSSASDPSSVADPSSTSAASGATDGTESGS
jgi:molecular chaperone GrpE